MDKKLKKNIIKFNSFQRRESMFNKLKRFFGFCCLVLALASNCYAQSSTKAKLEFGNNPKYFLGAGVATEVPIPSEQFLLAVESSLNLGFISKTKEAEPMFFDFSVMPYTWTPLSGKVSAGFGLKLGFCKEFYTSINPFLEFDIDEKQTIRLGASVSDSISVSVNYNYYF